MEKYLFIIIFIFSATTSSANETFFKNNEVAIGYSFFTHHVNQKKHYNENNHGIMISLNDTFISTLNNSHYNRSWFVGYSLRTKKKEIKDLFIRGNLHVGPLYGYKDSMPNIEGWTLGVAPTIEFGIKNVSLETMLSPAQGGVIVSMIKIYF